MLEKRIKDEIKKRKINGNVIELKTMEEIASACGTTLFNVMKVLRFGRL